MLTRAASIDHRERIPQSPTATAAPQTNPVVIPDAVATSVKATSGSVIALLPIMLVVSIASKRGPSVRSNRSPASVGETLRVVRVSSRTPKRASSCRTV
jgi:putative heme iron utilization protein